MHGILGKTITLFTVKGAVNSFLFLGADEFPIHRDIRLVTSCTCAINTQHVSVYHTIKGCHADSEGWHLSVNQICKKSYCVIYLALWLWGCMYGCSLQHLSQCTGPESLPLGIVILECGCWSLWGDLLKGKKDLSATDRRVKWTFKGNVNDKTKRYLRVAVSFWSSFDQF